MEIVWNVTVKGKVRMRNFSKNLIILISVLFLITGIIALNHYHSEGVFQTKDKDHCSICAYVFTISNAILIIFIFSVIVFAVSEQVIKKQVSALIRICFFLPPSLAPPVIV